MKKIIKSSKKKTAKKINYNPDKLSPDKEADKTGADDKADKTEKGESTTINKPHKTK